MNRNTLFGTTLERKNISDLPPIDDSKNENLNKYDNFEPMKTAKVNYEQHKSKLEEFDKLLKLNQNESKFNIQVYDDFVLPKLYKEESLDFNEFNKIKKKYKICRITNAENQNKDFYNSLKTEDKVLRDIIWKHIAQKRSKKEIEANLNPKTVHLEKSGYEIPRNICHKFRYSFCDEALSNENVITKLKGKIPEKNPVKSENKLNGFPLSEYEYLGTIIRSNIFSLTDLHRQSKTSYKNSYNGWKTFKSRDTSVPQQFKFQSDELSKWSTACIVEQKVYKEWQNRHDELIRNKTNV